MSDPLDSAQAFPNSLFLQNVKFSLLRQRTSAKLQKLKLVHSHLRISADLSESINTFMTEESANPRRVNITFNKLRIKKKRMAYYWRVA